MNFNDVFGTNSVPPADTTYASVVLNANATWQWPYNYSGSNTVIAKIMDVNCTVASTVTLPDTTQVSLGEDFLVRNTGSQTISFVLNNGTALATVAAGQSQYFYLTDNTTAHGAFNTVLFGVGTASINAASLVGYGLMASGTQLNTAVSVIAVGAAATIDATYRAQLVNFTGGAATLTFADAAVLGNNFFTLVHNSGTGTLSLAAFAGQTIDGSASFTVQPGESLIVVCSGTALYTVGYGRSTVYQFTQLVLDVSAAGTFTLSATQASNKMLTFTGNPASAVTVVVPNVVSVYYVQSAISTAQTITVKTAAGTGIGISQSTRVVALCDATNVYQAQSPSAGNTTVSLVDGSATAPSLNFSTSTNTGLYKDASPGVGVAVAGASVGAFVAAGWSGNAATATVLQTARNINGVSFNGSANINVNTNNSVTFNNGGAGGASGSTFNGGAALTVSYNTVGAPSTGGTGASGTWGISISGNAVTATSAGSVTNAVTFNNGGAGGASGSTFNGGVALTVSYNTVGAPSTTGANASGTWGISISGNAATATSATSATTATNLAGGTTGSLPYQSGVGATSMLAAGTSGYVLTANGAGVAPSWQAPTSTGWTNLTVVNSIGGGATFGGIPSSAKAIRMMFNNISSGAATQAFVRLGTAGGIDSGNSYSWGTSSGVSTATQFGNIQLGSGAGVLLGIMEFHLIDGTTNTWTMSFAGTCNSASYVVSGSKALSGSLTQIQFASTGGNLGTGSINVSYM